MPMNYMNAKKRPELMGGVVKRNMGGRLGKKPAGANDTTGMSRAGLYPQEERYSLDHPGRSKSTQPFPKRGVI